MLSACQWPDVESAMEVVGGSGSCPAGVLEVWVEKVFEMAIGTCDKKRGDKSMILDWNTKIVQKNYIKTLLVPHQATMWSRLGKGYDAKAGPKLKGVGCENKNVLLDPKVQKGFLWRGKEDGKAPLELDHNKVNDNADGTKNTEVATPAPKRKRK